jgi:hypothetical protein
LRDNYGSCDDWRTAAELGSSTAKAYLSECKTQK